MATSMTKSQTDTSLQSNDRKSSYDGSQNAADDKDVEIVYKVGYQAAKEWHRDSDLEFRVLVVQQTLQQLFQIPDLPDLHNTITYVCLQIARDIEYELFLNASNRGEYYHLACAMAVELDKEMSKKESPSGLGKLRPAGYMRPAGVLHAARGHLKNSDHKMGCYLHQLFRFISCTIRDMATSMTQSQTDTSLQSIDRKSSYDGSQNAADDKDVEIVYKVGYPAAKEWHRDLDLEFRVLVVQLTLQKLFRITDLPDLNNTMTYVCFQIVRDIEFELFLNASNRGEYYHLACVMAVELDKEMSKKESPSGMATEQESPKTNEIATMYAISKRCNVKKSVKKTSLQLRYDKILENVLHELRIRFGFKLQVSNLDKQSGLLYTGNCTDLDKQKQMNWPEPLLKQEYGEFDMESPMESGDPKQRYTRCSKTNEHEKMILFADFSITHLPENLRSKKLFDFIWTFAMITVRIEINTISVDRPKQIPGTEIEYPCSVAFENTPTHGTGRICNVTKHSADNHKFSKFKVCPCERCKTSGHPSKEWGEILIFTAAHVVHDNSEAGTAKCRLFYHSDDASSEEKYLVGVNVVERDIERDWCRFKCVTCDIDLVNKLQDLLSLFFTQWYEVFQEYRTDSKKNRCTIIVSHPHGYLKRLSLGRWTKRFGAKDVNVPYHSRYLYDAPTCGGSSGATVHFLGKSGGNMHWFDQHIHSGCYGPMRKQSGVGWENKF